jgi:hypothetical protein
MKNDGQPAEIDYLFLLRLALLCYVQTELSYFLFSCMISSHLLLTDMNQALKLWFIFYLPEFGIIICTMNGGGERKFVFLRYDPVSCAFSSSFLATQLSKAE